MTMATTHGIKLGLLEESTTDKMQLLVVIESWFVNFSIMISDVSNLL